MFLLQIVLLITIFLFELYLYIVAWFVSNCGAKNNRLEFAHQLQKYIDVDIYGGCGTKNCPRHSGDRCLEVLAKEYKFYLAFENSNCRDYITEKFYVNALGYCITLIHVFNFQ